MYSLDVCARSARAPLIEGSEVNTPAWAGVAYVSPRQARSLVARHADALREGARTAGGHRGWMGIRLTC
jgi:hypothetical protein